MSYLPSKNLKHITNGPKICNETRFYLSYNGINFSRFLKINIHFKYNFASIDSFPIFMIFETL